MLSAQENPCSVHTWTEYQTYRYFKLYGSDLPFSRRIVRFPLIRAFKVTQCSLDRF